MIAFLSPLCAQVSKFQFYCLRQVHLAENVKGWGILASQKLSGETPQDLTELQDPKILGYLFIFGSYFKLVAYC